MNPPPTPAKPTPLRLSVFAAGGLLMLATLAVYANTSAGLSFSTTSRRSWTI
jgi:hypothetical protein